MGGWLIHRPDRPDSGNRFFLFFFHGPCCKHPGAVQCRRLPESTKPTTKPLTSPSMEASSPHAGGERRCFGRVSKDVTQERGLAIKVCGVGEGKGQQACGKGTCGSYGEKSRPPGDKGGNTGSALGHGGTARPRPREQADEGGSFGTPATTDCKTEHNQAAPTGELRVGTLFCPACFSQRCSSGAACPAPGHTGRSKRRDQCSVNGQLRASPQRQAIGDRLDGARAQDRIKSKAKRRSFATHLYRTAGGPGTGVRAAQGYPQLQKGQGSPRMLGSATGRQRRDRLRGTVHQAWADGQLRQGCWSCPS